MPAENPWWYDFLAIIPYVALATWSLSVAGAFLVVVRMGDRSRHYVWGVALFVMLASYFFALAITGGSSPVIPRRALAIPIRTAAIGMLILGYGWLLLWARAHIEIRPNRRAEAR